MSEQTEKKMLAAITAHFKDENTAMPMTKLRAVEVRAVTDNGDHGNGERMVYNAGETFQAIIMLAAPLWIPGTSATRHVREYGILNPNNRP